MRRDNKFFNGDFVIYGGTIVFFIIAIAIGIVLYTSSSKKENNVDEIVSESQKEEKTESASTEIGKTVEEQKENLVVENKIDTSEVTENKASNVNESKKDTKNNAVDNNSAVNNKVTETKKEVTFTKPTDGEIICEYAKDNLIYSETLKEWITHTAIDIKADKTSVIKAAADGIVKSIVNDPRYGLTVIMQHDDGYETVYSNLLTAEFVVEGEEIKQGQTIGTAGNTASFESEMESHLHFELLKDGNYLDPNIYIK